MSQPASLDTRLPSVLGGRTATALEKAFGMQTVRDLLWHVPRRYSNRGDLTPLTDLPIGEHVTVLAQVLDVRERRMQRGGSIVEVRITDGVGSLQLTFFNQRWRAATLRAGMRGIFAGKVSDYRGQLQLQHPDYELFDQVAAGDAGEPTADDLGGPNVLKGPGWVPAKPTEAELSLTREKEAALSEAAARAFAERPVPIYPATSKVATWTIQQAVDIVLKVLGPIDDPIPAELRAEEAVLELDAALRRIHQPEQADDWRSARHSLRFREAFDLQLALLDRRRRMGEAPGTRRARVEGGLLDMFDASLPFELTGDQREAGDVIAEELSRPHPMHRLLQGEVGSGKTVVALRAMLQVAESGGQSALLAPTEVLAAQHFRSIADALGPDMMARLHPVLLTSKMPTSERRRALLATASGQSLIAVGTHALLSEGVSFYDLGLAVIDEQHRFGVEQREALRQKGAENDAQAEPHVLTMTATPIPRTVALTAFGDLETSVIRELPPGRQGIETFAVPIFERPAWAERAWLRAAEEVALGRQVYVVCPAISAGKQEEGADDAAAAAARPMASVEQTLEELRARPDYASIRVAALTGAMKSDEKDQVMRAFSAGDIDVLVATTVIEVGVNVPNATTMIVRDAERFGISQLHQLRGRVGRGEHAGLCLLLTAAEPGTNARERIEAVAATIDGFELAERDLELRREGDILGTAQSGGRSTLRLLRVAEHGELIERAREVAAALLRRDPGLTTAPLLAAQLEEEARVQQLENLAKS